YAQHRLRRPGQRQQTIPRNELPRQPFLAQPRHCKAPRIPQPNWLSMSVLHQTISTASQAGVLCPEASTELGKCVLEQFFPLNSQMDRAPTPRFLLQDDSNPHRPVYLQIPQASVALARLQNENGPHFQNHANNLESERPEQLFGHAPRYCSV